jgi:NADPH-dependent curcumin reductase CurA
MVEKNVQVLLRRRPEGEPREDDFELVERDVPELAEGQLLVRNRFLSLDPYMRGRMSDAKSYAPPAALGAVMLGGTVGEVVASRHARFAVGDRVLGTLGWQRFAVSDGAGLSRVDDRVPLSAHLGVCGMPGITAWIGLYDLAQPKAGETVLVSAAAGAVGSVVGQLAKRRGCRAVGVAGGPAKCEHVVRVLGFDACVDYRAPDFEARLAEATPSGVDVYFENVGGAVLEAAVARLNPFARIPLCGLIADYNAREQHGLHNLRALLTQRVRLQGFIVTDHLERWPAARAELVEAVASGGLRYHETIAEGLERAPRALIGLLRGENLGKQLVRID